LTTARPPTTNKTRPNQKCHTTAIMESNYTEVLRFGINTMPCSGK
jgi:hypothetical protein